MCVFLYAASTCSRTCSAGAGYSTGAGRTAGAIAQGGKSDVCLYGGLFIQRNGEFLLLFRCAGKDFHYYSGFPSLTETGKTILLLRANPADDGGDNGGAIISTRDYVHYGSFSARIRMPDVGAVQPKLALFADFSLRDDDPVFGFDEFTLEFRVADKNNLYSRVSRREPDTGENPLVQESVLTPSSSFNAASKFYVYGMDWTQDKVTWWLQTSSSSEKIILYEWTENIPSEPLKLEFRLYHDKANPALYPYELEIDWIKYTPSAI